MARGDPMNPIMTVRPSSRPGWDREEGRGMSGVFEPCIAERLPRFSRRR